MVKNFIEGEWTELLEIDDLELYSDNTEHYHAMAGNLKSDIIYRARVKNYGNQEFYFCMLLEFQSTVDHSMSIRIHQYMGRIWDKYITDTPSRKRKRKGYKLPMVVPIVFYTGTKKWTSTTSFKDKVNHMDLLDGYVPDYKYILINIYL